MANRKLIVEIVGDASSLSRSFRSATGQAQRFSVGIGTLVKSALVIGAVQKAVEGLSSAVHLGIEEFADNAKVAAQTSAAIKSTGGIAGVTAKHVDALGLALSNLSGIDDEVVRSGENVLLSFRNIRNQAGKGNDIFDRATKAAVNFAARTGRDVPQAANILGRALEDPARKATSLARAGIVLSASQIKLIKNLEDSGHALDAQKLILAELEKRFGGAAAAAGKTLPGQLNILKDRFKDLAGQGIGLIAPSVTKAVTGLTGFVKKLSEAQGAGGKLRVLGSAVSSLDKEFKDFATHLVKSARRAFDNIDWAQVLDKLRSGFVAEFHRVRKLIEVEVALLGDVARTAGAALKRGFDAINWQAVGQAIISGLGTLGRLAGDGVVRLLNLLTDAVQHVNFQKVGKALVDGFALAVVAVGNFLINVPWGKVIGASIRLAVAAVKGLGSLLLGAGKELGRALLNGLIAGIKELGQQAEKAALEIVLKILKTFDVTIPGIHRHIIPGLHSLIKDIQGQIDSLHGKTITVTVKARDETGGVLKQAGVTHGRNVIENVKQKASVVTRPVDQSLGLADTAGAATKAADAAAKALQTMLDKLNLAVAKASLTKTLKDDLSANQALITALEKQIRLHKDDLNLQNQLVSAQQARIALVQQQTEAEAAARSARQFRALGLGPTGDQITPGVANLQKQLAGLSDRIAKGAPITSKLKSQLAGIRKILTGELGATTVAVRGKINELFQTIRDGFNQGGGNLTKTTSLDTSAIVKGLGLDASTAKALRARLSRFNSAGIALSPNIGPEPLLVGAAAGSFVLHNTIELDGKVVAHQTRKVEQKFKRQNPRGRRGRR